MNNISKGEQLKKSIALLNWLDRDNNGETQENNLIWANLDKLIDKWVKVRVGTNWTGEVEMNRIADQRISNELIDGSVCLILPCRWYCQFVIHAAFF